MMMNILISMTIMKNSSNYKKMNNNNNNKWKNNYINNNKLIMKVYLYIILVYQKSDYMHLK